MTTIQSDTIIKMDFPEYRTDSVIMIGNLIGTEETMDNLNQIRLVVENGNLEVSGETSIN